MSDFIAEQDARNQAILLAIIKCIILCGEQNIPIRGKRQDSSNFLALLRFRAEADEVLKHHLENAPKNATYLSPMTQNEIIDICGNVLRCDIIEKCKKARFFTVLVDETTDILTSEQVSISIRFLDVDSLLM